MTKSKSSAIGFALMLGFAFSVYLLWLTATDSTEHALSLKAKPSAIDLNGNCARPKAGANQPATSKKALLDYSKSDWLGWMKDQAHFRISRNQEAFKRTVVDCDLEAFKKVGLGPEVYAIIAYELSMFTGDLYPSGVSDMSPEDFAKFGVEDELPKLISETPNSSTYFFPVTKRVTSGPILSYGGDALAKRIAEVMGYNLDLPDEVRKVGPILGEAIEEWCLSQPVLRRLGSAELTVTFQNVVHEGKEVYRITESMPNIDGNGSIVNQFITPEVPPPYDRVFKSR